MADIDRFKTCYLDDEDAFGVVNSDDTSALGLAVLGGSVQEEFTREVLEEDSTTMDHGMWAPIEGSSAGSTFGFSTRAGGLGIVGAVMGAVNGDTPVRSALARVIMSLFGTESIIDGDTVAVGASASSFDLTAQSTLTETDPVNLLVECDTGGAQVIPVTIASGTCTPLLEPSDAPTVGGVVYGSLNYHLSEAYLPATSFQGKFVSDTTGHKFRAIGAAVNQMVLSLSARQLGKIEFQSMVNSWAVITDSLAAVSPAPSRPWMDATFRLAAFGTAAYAAGQLMKVKGDFQMTFARALQIEDDETHAEGASGYEDPGNEPFCKFSPILPYSTDWRDAITAETYYHALVASSRAPGKGVACYVRKVIQDVYPGKVNNNGMIRSQPSFALASGYTAPGVTFSIF